MKTKEEILCQLDCLLSEWREEKLINRETYNMKKQCYKGAIDSLKWVLEEGE